MSSRRLRRTRRLRASTTIASLATTLLFLVPQARADDAAMPSTSKPWYASKRRVANLAVTVGTAGIYVASETFLKSDLAPAECRWCNPPGLDTSIRDALLWDAPSHANTASNVTGFVVGPALALGLVAVESVPNRNAAHILDDLVPIVETVTVSQVFVQAVKFSVGRERPFVHFGTGVNDDDNVSFFSGHSALAFGVVTSAGVIAHERGYKTEPYIWAIGLPLAASTAYLRIAADKHYFSDVVTGSLFGVAAGLVIPRLTRSLRVDIAPRPNGVAVIGTW